MFYIRRNFGTIGWPLREARAVRIQALMTEIPQKKLSACDAADLLRRRLGLEEPFAVPLPLASNRGAAA
jgi:hypothetical protein